MTRSPAASRSSFAAQDDFDLKIAARDLADAHAMLLEAHAIADRRTCIEAIKVAIARLALAGRWIDHVVKRRSRISGTDAKQENQIKPGTRAPTNSRRRTARAGIDNTTPATETLSIGFRCDHSLCDADELTE